MEVFYFIIEFFCGDKYFVWTLNSYTNFGLFGCIKIRINMCIQEKGHSGTIRVIAAPILVNLWGHKTRTENIPSITGPLGPPVLVVERKLILVSLNATLQRKTTAPKI